MDDSVKKIDELREAFRRVEEAFEAGASGFGRERLESALEAARNIPAYRELFRAVAARYLADDREEQGRRLKDALLMRPDDYFLLRAMGIFLSAIGRDEEATEYFDRALEEKPDDFVSMRRKGVSLSRLGRMDEALMWFDIALEINPEDSASMRNLGVSLSRSGRNEEAIAWFDRALAVNSQDHSAMRQKGVSLSMLGRLDEALSWYDLALEVNPADRAALLNKARTLLDAGDPARAVDTYDRLIAAEQNNPYHYLERAIALAKLGRSDEARDTVNQAYGLTNPSERLRRNKSYWLKRLGLAPGKARSGIETPDPGGEYGDIARVMEKAWEIFREDIESFRGKIAEAKNHFDLFIHSSGMFDRSRIFLMAARKWNSYTPALPLGNGGRASLGGGYFLFANGIGTVIDPGFNFLENFSAMGGRLSDIHNVVVTHAHNDHTNDLESILTLFHQRNKAGRNRSGRLASRSQVNLYLNLGAFQKFSPLLNLRRS
ncbi:MAG: tetratricopeptide repeat protein, partial [Planctomycetes bacterium]|nr:tetratricopeptide repeat protein [Planctomycetota bacterium]